MKNIVLVAAHPDDIAFGMSGAALILRKKFRVHVVCTTTGQRGRRDWTPERTSAVRQKEEAAACKRMRAELTFLHKMDAEVFADRESCEQLAAVLRRIKPVAVFTLWPVDTHPDHTAVSEMTQKAMRLSKSKAELIFYETHGRTQSSAFAPDVFVDVEGVLAEKLRIIRCHRCQNAKNGQKDILVAYGLQQMQFRGAQVGRAYAEGFKFRYPPVAGRKSVLLGEGFGG
jgi:LmbE family N-acetylglucosaminyl deacetylase